MAKREGKNEPEPKTQHMSQASTMPGRAPTPYQQTRGRAPTPPWLEDDGGYSIALRPFSYAVAPGDPPLRLSIRPDNVIRLEEVQLDGAWIIHIGVQVHPQDIGRLLEVEGRAVESGKLYWLIKQRWPSHHITGQLQHALAAGVNFEAATPNLKQILDATRHRPRPKVTPILDNGFAVIPSSAPLETMLQGIQDAAEGAHSWADFETTTVPTYRRLMGRGGKDGVIDLSVRLQDGDARARHTMLSILWGQVCELDDLTGDVLLAAFTHWLTHREEGSTWITADAILDYRGIKPITKKEGDSRRRAGHHLEHKAVIARAFEQLDHLWLNIDGVEVIELEGTRRKPTKLHLESKAISISDRISQGGLSGGHLPIAWCYRPGNWAKPFLQEGFRQTALLAQKSLQYDPYRETWEKRLSRYFAFHWRIQAHQGNYSQPYRVTTLLKAIAMEPNARYPQKTRERLEKALDRLQKDKVIADWEYRKGEEGALPTKGWLTTWLSWTVKVTPPFEVIHHYARISEVSSKTRATTPQNGRRQGN